MTLRLLSAVGGLQILLIGVAITLIDARQNQLSMVFGGLLSFFSFLMLVIFWKRVFFGRKKNLALGIFLIVIKYGILILVLATLPRVKEIDPLFFSFGIIANPAAVILSGLGYKQLFKLNQ